MVISRPVPLGALEALDDGALIAAARRGDRQAAGVYIARHRSYLMAAARSIGGQRLDPEDLLSTALVQLLGQWGQGTGPDSNATAYLIRSMRNAAIDESRSPRSRVETFGDVDETDPVHRGADDPRLRQAELHDEFDVVRRALDRLPADQRLVLRETVVLGRKPAEVAADARRSATAVSSLAARARRGLRRAVLVELLSAGGTECRQNAERLPEVVATDPDAHRDGERGLAHVRTCPRCRANWARFAALTSALGVLPALVVADWTAGGVPASAALSTSSAGGSPGGGGPGIASGPAGAGMSGSSGSSASAAAWSALPRPGLLAAVGSAARALVHAPLLLAGIVALVLGAGAGVTALALGAQDPSRVVQFGDAVTPLGQAPEAVFDAVVERVGGTAVLSVRFDVPGATWRIEGATIDLAPDVRLRSAPIGWGCDPSAAGLACAVDGDSPKGGGFVFEVDDGWPSGPFSMRLDVLTGEGDRFAAEAEGTFGNRLDAFADGFSSLSRLY